MNLRSGPAIGSSHVLAVVASELEVRTRTSNCHLPQLRDFVITVSVFGSYHCVAQLDRIWEPQDVSSSLAVNEPVQRISDFV